MREGDIILDALEDDRRSNSGGTAHDVALTIIAPENARRLIGQGTKKRATKAEIIREKWTYPCNVIGGH